MNIEFNKLDNVNAEITLVIEQKDLAPKVKEQLKNIARTHKEPGFRPGHVPAGLIQKKYGEAIKYDVLNKTISDEIFNFVKKEELKVLGNPVPDKDNVPDFNAEQMTFKFRVGLAPEIESPVKKEFHIPYYKIKVSDDMISKQDELLRRRFGSQVEGEVIEDNAVVKGSITELDAAGNAKEDGIVVEDGILSPQYFKDDAQKALFTGKNKGASIVFNPAATCEANPVELSSMLQISKEVAENVKSDFRFDVKEIIVLRPAELDQEYFDGVFGKDKVHNDEEYKEGLKNMIAAQLTNDSNYRFTIDARNEIMKAIGDIELPDAILRDYLVQTDENITEETADETYSRMRPDLIWQLSRDAIAQQLEIKLEEADLTAMAKLIARNQFAQYGMTSVPDEMLDKYANDILKDKKGREQIANQALDNKLFNGIKASVTLDEKEVDVEQFNALFTAEAEK